MDFVNESRMAAGWTMGFERDGRELIVVAVKGTFLIPDNGGEPVLAEEQVKLTEADQFTGEPGFSAPLYESDYAHRKPFCDVLVNGSAYAPGGRPARQVPVGIKVGQMIKSFAVAGNRVWRSGLTGLSASTPEPFDAMPITYDNAYGGVDDSKGEPTDVKTFLQNPVGRGYSHYKKDLDGKLLPNTEEIGAPIESPGGNYRPMSLGSIGRNWQPRVRFAGTYDQDWLDNHAPFWPDDFDYRHFQAAPPDQQIPYPVGGEEVVLKNLSRNGHVGFGLPLMATPVLLIPYKGSPQEVTAVIDTLLIEPDLGRFTLTWRVTYPLRKSCFDLMRVVVGKTSRAWYGRQRFGGKPYYRNLAEMARARKR